MYKVHHPLKKTGFILSAEFKETTDGEGRKDWEIEYTPGPKAKAEHLFFTAGRRELFAGEISADATPTDAESVPEELPVQEQLLVDKLTGQGIDQRTAVELVKEDAAEVAAQLDAFPQRNLKGVDNPTGWLINAIRKKYRIPTIAPARKAKAEKAQQAQEASTLKQQKELHRERHFDVFGAYLAAELQKLETARPEAYGEFNKRFQKLVDVLPSLEPESIEQVRIYDFKQFVNDNPGLKILTFWQWDQELNQEPFVQPN